MRLGGAFAPRRRRAVAKQPMRITTKSCVLAAALLVAKTALGVDEGDMAPDFTLPVLGADAAMSLSETQGKVLYIDFWASWCAPCRVAVPRIVALQEELGGEAFEVIGINIDEQVDDALDFAERFAMNYVNVIDPDGDTAESWDLLAVPMSYVVDPEGRVTLVHAGFRRGDMEPIRAHILELLGRRAQDDIRDDAQARTEGDAQDRKQDDTQTRAPARTQTRPQARAEHDR